MFGLFNEHSVVLMEGLEAYGFAEPPPVAGKVHALLVADEVFDDPDGYAAGAEYGVGLLQNNATCSPEGVALRVAEIVLGFIGVISVNGTTATCVVMFSRINKTIL